MFQRTTQKYWVGLASLLALALAGGAGFKWNCSFIVEWVLSLF